MSELPISLQSKLNTVNSDLAAAREATQAANKAKANLDREIREYFTTEPRPNTVGRIAEIVAR